MRLLAATLEEIGNQPDPRNIGAFRKIFAECPSLLVAGYSDHDWDIFPILSQLSDKLRHVYWLVFNDTERTLPQITRWLSSLGTRHTLIVGDPMHLLKDLAISAGGTLVPSSYTTSRLTILSELFINDDPDSLTTIRTAAAFTALLHDRGVLRQQLLDRLLRHSTVISCRVLHAHIHRMAAHNCHTGRKLRRAIWHMRHVVSLKDCAADRSVGTPLADDLVWMGYEHLCLLKRPSWRWLLVPALFWNRHQARRAMARGLWLARMLPARRRDRLRALVQFYQGDLWHSWAQMSLAFGRHAARFARPLFNRASRWYHRALQRDEFLMNWEYYWLRRLEASILSGDVVDPDACLTRLHEIELAYDMLQNHVQRGNTEVYKALVSETSIAASLAKAERLWSSEDGDVPSGLLRVWLYRRYFGLTPLWRFRRPKQ